MITNMPSENVALVQLYVMQHFENESVPVMNQQNQKNVCYHRVRWPILSGARGVHASTTVLKPRLKDYRLLLARSNGAAFALRISAVMVV